MDLEFFILFVFIPAIALSIEILLFMFNNKVKNKVYEFLASESEDNVTISLMFLLVFFTSFMAFIAVPLGLTIFIIRKPTLYIVNKVRETAKNKTRDKTEEQIESDVSTTSTYMYDRLINSIKEYGLNEEEVNTVLKNLNKRYNNRFLE